MNRQPERLTERTYDLLVIGGGVLGSFVAWDAALRGLEVALIERDDFAAGTSFNSLKIIHGGLRYLQSLDLVRLRRSVRERSTWLRIAPHLVEPLPIIIPTYPRGLQRRQLLRAALWVNDIVAMDRNHGLAPERALPRGRGLSRHECLDLVPELERPDLTGGVLFYDAQMYSSERLVLEVVQGAHDAGALVVNHAEATDRLGNHRLDGVLVRDRIGGDLLEVRARSVVNATGPGLPRLASTLTATPTPAARIEYALALNLMLPALGHDVAFSLSGHPQSPDAPVPAEKRQYFIAPWRGRSLVGTGHYRHSGETDGFSAGEESIAAFLSEVNAVWPGERMRREDVVLVHEGLVPCAPGAAEESVAFLKRSPIVDHRIDAGSVLVSAATVKYTEARKVAEEVVDLVFRRLGNQPPPCRTANTPLPGAPDEGVAALRREAARRYGSIVAPDILEHLVRSYGRRYERVLSGVSKGATALQRIVAGRPVVRAQAVHAVRAEMAQTVDDVWCRRLELGARGESTEEGRELVSRLLREARAPAPSGTSSHS